MCCNLHCYCCRYQLCTVLEFPEPSIVMLIMFVDSPSLLAQRSHFTTIRTLEKTEVIWLYPSEASCCIVLIHPDGVACTGIKSRKQQALQQACREHCLQTGIKGTGKSKHCSMHVDSIACKQAGKRDSLLHLCIMLRWYIDIYVVSSPVCRKVGRVRISECLQSNRDEKKRRAPPHIIALPVWIPWTLKTPQNIKIEHLTPTTILLGLIPFFLSLTLSSLCGLAYCIYWLLGKWGV